MLGEIFIIKKDELEQKDYKNANPMSFAEGIEAKGFEVTILAALQELFTQESFDEILDQQEEFYTESEEGPWILQLPFHLTSSLGTSSEEQLEAVYEKWIETEEIQMMLWDYEELKTTYWELVELARKALQGEKELYIWVSL